VAALSFASGAPNGIATQAVPNLYAAAGVDLAAIGLLAFVEVPYLAKALWAPAVDRWGDRRTWAALCLAAIAGLVLALAFLPADSVPASAWVVLYGIVFASATLDLACDAWAVEAVPAEAAGPAAAVRVTAYRAALVVAGGFLVARAATLGRGPTFAAAAAVLAALAVVAARAPRTPRRTREAAPVRAPLLDLWRRPGIVAFAAFVVLFKAGDYLMGRMTKPCLLARGFTAQEIGDLVTPMEIGAVVLGAWVGGALTRRWGLFRALWVLGLLQAVSNLGYAAAADAGKGALWAAAAVEPFCSGLGTAPFVALLLVSCRREHAAVQFALLTALMALGRILCGSVSGVLASSLGFSAFFSLSFLAALPAFLLLPRPLPPRT
jgi:PAT family beta-lactamase induction signal transducer AmpG